MQYEIAVACPASGTEDMSMFPFADPMRLTQNWCEALSAVTRANMATCAAVGTQMMSFWMGGMRSAPAGPTSWLDQWSALTTPRYSPFTAFTPLRPPSAIAGPLRTPTTIAAASSFLRVGAK